MIRADTQDELNTIPCPGCGEKRLRMQLIGYAEPCCFTAHCEHCFRDFEGEGHPPVVLSVVEHVVKRANMYGLTPETAQKWATTPDPELGDKTPEQCVDSDPDGVWRSLERLMEREHE